MTYRGQLMVIWVTLFVGFPQLLSAKPQIEVKILLSVDWEGETLRPKNLAAMEEFNKKFPHYVVIHFLNAAYYTRKDFLSRSEINSRVRSVIRPNHELGLHVHAWKNLIEAAGVLYRGTPSYLANTLASGDELGSIARSGEVGSDVPLNRYSPREIYKIINFCLETLAKNGFSRIKSFRAGGWMSGPAVFWALQKSGLTIDSSAVPPHVVERLYPNSLLAKFNHELWENINEFSQPYQQDSLLWQFPNNIGLADYMNAEQFMDNYLNLLKEAEKSGKKSIYLHFGWHQESAVENFKLHPDGQFKLFKGNYLQEVEKGLVKIEQHAQTNGHFVNPVGFEHFFENNNSNRCKSILEP